jgi:hypothetical protein
MAASVLLMALTMGAVLVSERARIGEVGAF